MSKLFELNTKDYLKGLLMSILVPAILIVQQSLDKGELVLNWKAILMASISGALAYLMKNFFTQQPIAETNQDLSDYTYEQEQAINECDVILANVGLELVGTRPKDR